VSYTETVANATNFFEPAIAEHFRNLHRLAKVSGHKGILVLSAFGEDLPPQVRHFQIGEHESMTAAAMAFQTTRYNVYCSPAIYRSDLPAISKGGEADVIASLAPVTDSDADKGKDAPQSPMPADYVMETSPGNAQQFLFLSKALTPDEAKPLCAAMKRATKADGASELSHVFRVPGTLNWPNKAKLARGRSPEPFLVRVTKAWDGNSLTHVDELRAVLEPHWQAPRTERLATVAGETEYDIEDAKALYQWMADNGAIESDDDWRNAGMVAKSEFGEAGLELWEILATQGGLSDESLNRWRSFKLDKEGGVGLGTLLKLARDMGWTGSVRRSTASMFQGVAQIAASQAPSLVPEQGVSMIGGDPATVWASLDRFANPAPGDWANAAVLLRRLKIEVRWNAWTERNEIRENGEDWTERQDWHLDKIARFGSSHPHNYRPAESVLRRAIDSLARENIIDPARDLLDNLQKAWDGQARLHSWLSHACGVPYDAYYQAVSATILLGIVARIRCPGIKFDTMPVFASERQGTAKSTLARMLALNDDWFIENVALGESSKELVLLLAGKSVAEISEMRTRGEVDAVKAMISATHDEGRPAYGRATVKRPRRNIFIGTTNRIEFLEDPTGARRFLPIMVQGEIDLEFVRQHLPLLIGEAATLQSRGVDINLPREIWELAGKHQAAATTQSSAEVLLTDWFGGEAPCWISSTNLILLLRLALGREVARGVYAPVMTKLGFVNKTRRIGKDVPRSWVRGELDANEPGFGPQLSHSGRPTLQQLFPPQAPAASVPPLPY
jgi:hypothetical protein